MCEFLVRFRLLWVKAYPGLSTVKGSQCDTHVHVVGYRLNRLNEAIFMAGPKAMLTEIGIRHR